MMSKGKILDQKKCDHGHFVMGTSFAGNPTDLGHFQAIYNQGQYGISPRQEVYKHITKKENHILIAIVGTVRMDLRSMITIH